MQFKLLPLIGMVAAGTAAAIPATGPFQHYSDGRTQPIILYNGSDIVKVECLDGSRCATRTAGTAPTATGVQISSFRFTTGSSLGTDNFSFGVRGNATNAACTSNVKDNPFLGRGIVIYPSTGTLQVANFTTNCRNGNGLAGSTARGIRLAVNANYLVSVWADHENVGYSIDREVYNAQTFSFRYLPVAVGDCLADAAESEAVLCRKHAEDSPGANRAFVAHTQDVPFSITEWYLYQAPPRFTSP